MADAKYTNETVEVSEKQRKAQRSRNIAIAVILAIFVVLLYVVTWTKLGANIMQRPL